MTYRDVRYKNAAKEAPDFSDEFLVECPKCQACAFLLPMGEDATDSPHASESAMNPRYLECSACSFQRSWKPGDLNFLRTLVNWFGELSLYLRVGCGRHTVWALNVAHLSYLEAQLEQAVAGATELPPLLEVWLEDEDPIDIAASLARLRQRLPDNLSSQVTSSAN
ncbi:hypothetical protein FIV42_12470 [Persicimonas caeni]|uniref:Uncharacterized protein n=1 Tax=Persicimonas caeni TaxID=2292766 RepID=A0A4Y6PTT0_PERCE|nr:hypothetical protein [Persicimonas caeni]QDG51529.1 hypothetical protein FIV42_12470 [Persicimonas caeni]QED32750.1 hypothetical protein FRD00_12465 [Persicimonas caeni]